MKLWGKFYITVDKLLFDFKIWAFVLSLTPIGSVQSQNLTTDSIQSDSLVVYIDDNIPKTTTYLVIAPKKSGKAKVFSENKRLFIKTFDKHKMRGRLHFINDSTIYLYNTISRKSDTFKFSEIRTIRQVSLATNVLGITYKLQAISIYFISRALRQSNKLLVLILGHTMNYAIVPTYALSILFMQGQGSHSTHYTYHIYHAKGFKLKSSMVSSIYPPN